MPKDSKSAKEMPTATSGDLCMTQIVCLCADILPRCPDTCTAGLNGSPLYTVHNRKSFHNKSSKSLFVIVVKHKISCVSTEDPQAASHCKDFTAVLFSELYHP